MATRAVRPGGRVRAPEVNAGIAAARMLEGTRGGHGVAVRTSPDGLLISLAGGGRGRVLEAVITAAPPPGVLVLPSLCKYSALALDRRFSLTDVFPAYGRQVENDEVGVYPAKVGDFCLIIRYKVGNLVVAQLMVLRENPGRGAC